MGGWVGWGREVCGRHACAARGAQDPGEAGDDAGDAALAGASQALRREELGVVEAEAAVQELQRALSAARDRLHYAPRAAAV